MFDKQREQQILKAVAAGDAQGATRQSVAESLGMSASSLSHFLRVRGLSNTRGHRDGQALAAKIVRLAKERGASLDGAADVLGIGANHLRRVAKGTRQASAALVDSMMQHLYGFSYSTTSEEFGRRSNLNKQIEAQENSEIKKERAIIRATEKAAARERAMIDALTNGVSPSEVADRRYHGRLEE